MGWITTKNGKHINTDWLEDDEKKKNQQIEASKKEAEERSKAEKPKKLEERLSGDELEDAKDLIAELKSNEADVDENGMVTLYHHTTESAYNSILQSGKMKAKEDGLFFSTKKNGQAEGFGNKVLEFKIPVEKLVLDDVFGDEAHCRIPLPNRNSTMDVSKWIRRK